MKEKMQRISYFDEIDSLEKAYWLGWIFSIGLKKDGYIEVNTAYLDYESFCKAAKISSVAFRHEGFFLILNCELNVKFPLVTPDLSWAFLRACLESKGQINPLDSNSPSCVLNNDPEILKSIYNFCNIPGCLKDNCIFWEGNNCLDFLGKIYPDELEDLFVREFRDLYFGWSGRIPSLFSGKSLNFKWSKLREDAVPLFKSKASDSGFDITILDKIKQIGKVEMYSTGISVEPEYGWYLDLVPRSSIVKSGRILANSVGILDRSYRGEIFVPLIKIDEDAPDLDLPCRLVQIIPRPIVQVCWTEVESLSETGRGYQGFGSTGR